MMTKKIVNSFIERSIGINGVWLMLVFTFDKYIIMNMIASGYVVQ